MAGIKAGALGGPGKIEAAVEADLQPLPEALQRGALAATARLLARRLDAGLPARDATAAARELRVTMERLDQRAPIQDSDDVGDELEQRRRDRLRKAYEG